MEMCILDSKECPESSRFVFDDSYLILKFTGKKDEINTLRMLMYSDIDTRLLNQRLFAYGSINDFLYFLESKQALLGKPFIKELKTLLQLENNFLNLPHSGKL